MNMSTYLLKPSHYSFRNNFVFKHPPFPLCSFTSAASLKPQWSSTTSFQAQSVTERLSNLPALTANYTYQEKKLVLLVKLEECLYQWGECFVLFQLLCLKLFLASSLHLKISLRFLYILITKLFVLENQHSLSQAFPVSPRESQTKSWKPSTKVIGRNNLWHQN